MAWRDGVNLKAKTIGNRKKRLCVRSVRSEDKHPWLGKLSSLQFEKHKSVRWAERTPSWLILCLSICRFLRWCFVILGLRAQPYAQFLFSISNSFCYSFFSTRRRTVQPEVYTLQSWIPRGSDESLPSCDMKNRALLDRFSVGMNHDSMQQSTDLGYISEYIIIKGRVTSSGQEDQYQ